MVSEPREGRSSEVSWTRERRERQDDERDHGKLLALADPGRLEAGPPGPRVGLDMALGHNKQGAMGFVLSPGGRGCGDGAGKGSRRLHFPDRLLKSVCPDTSKPHPKVPGLLLTGRVK